MRVILTAEIAAVLDYPSLIDRIRDYSRSGCSAPDIPPFDLSSDRSQPSQHLMLRPAWREGGYIGVALATDFAGNTAENLPQRMGTYLLMSGKTGAPLALLDGLELTLRSAASTSALAARYLARPDCERLLMIGANALSAHLIRAHTGVRPVCNILIWDQDQSKARLIADMLNRENCKVDYTDDLEAAVRGAHIICCNHPDPGALLDGSWLQPGQHLDLTSLSLDVALPSSIEARAAVYRDRLKDSDEEGETLGTLAALTRGERTGRNKYNSITLFHYTGTGLEELAGAKLAFERC